jgi:hypothetical protein
MCLLGASIKFVISKRSSVFRPNSFTDNFQGGIPGMTWENSQKAGGSGESINDVNMFFVKLSSSCQIGHLDREI